MQPAHDNPAGQELGGRSPALILLSTASLLKGLLHWPNPEANGQEASWCSPQKSASLDRESAEWIRDTNRKDWAKPICPSRNSQSSEEKGKINRQWQCDAGSTMLMSILAGYRSSEESSQADAVKKPPRRQWPQSWDTNDKEQGVSQREVRTERRLSQEREHPISRVSWASYAQSPGSLSIPPCLLLSCTHMLGHRPFCCWRSFP